MLEHFKCCIFEKKEASVVYLGGSITEGQGVADKRLCWQGLLQTFLDREWKECRFSAVNAGIGGTALLAALKDRGTEPRVLLPDLVHPSREGYEVYYERLKGFLKEVMISGSFCRDRKSVAENPYTSCRMVPAANADLHGFVHENIAMCGHFGSYVSSCTPGSWLEYAFEGDKIGIFYTIACDSGDMEWSLDGGEWQYLPSWDAYALKFDRGSARMLAQGLERREHILRIRVKDSRAEKSMGNFIRIGDFLV